MLRLSRILATLALVVGFWTPTAAQTTPVVVELYTSQGCSSCPPADEMLTRLSRRDDIIALALHVDYWDYLGWKDLFGARAYSERQRGYARAAGKRTIYTPQMIVQGQTHVIGAHEKELTAAIARHVGGTAPLGLSARRLGDEIVVELTPKGRLKGRAVVQVVEFSPGQDVEVLRGENAGKTIHYANIVRTWSLIGAWDGASPATLRHRVAAGLPVAVIVQIEKNGPILAAQRVK